MSLTCISCKLLFSLPELHHEHYKSDWHRYNLKRKLAELPPVSKEEFEKRAAAYQETIKEKEKVSLKCTTCGKHFSSENSLSSHLKSKRHLVAEAIAKLKPRERRGASASQEPKKELNIEDIDISESHENDNEEDWTDDDDDDSDWESCDEEDEEDGISRVTVDTNDCLFCDHQSDSTENNISHMTDAHSFFIPDIEYVSDIDGLIGYLAGKIIVGHICLWCNGKGKGFKSLKSVKQHMVDKGHCKILYEGDALGEFADFYDYSSTDAEKEVFDDDIIVNLLEDSDFELVLPSGSTIGHRSLALYYKQNLKPVTADNAKKIRKVLQHYKAVGYLGASGPAAVKKARDIVFMQRVKNRYNLKLGVKGNKLQPHFRSQVMF